MTEYHCEFCGCTGKELRNEQRGSCNSCGAPLGITKKEAEHVWNEYSMNLKFMGTSTVYFPASNEVHELTVEEIHTHNFIQHANTNPKTA